MNENTFRCALGKIGIQKMKERRHEMKRVDCTKGNRVYSRKCEDNSKDWIEAFDTLSLSGVLINTMKVYGVVVSPVVLIIISLLFIELVRWIVSTVFSF